MSLTGQVDIKLSLEVLSSVGTAAAAIFSAYSAWAARNSAASARDAVDEARLARRNEILPRFVLDKEFLDFSFSWYDTANMEGRPRLLARKDDNDTHPQSPKFTLSNVGERPALDITIVFELIDHHGDLTIPEGYNQIGISVENTIHPTTAPKSLPIVSYKRPDGLSTGFPAYRKASQYLANLVPGSPRSISFPEPLLHRIFMRGLQAGGIVCTEKPLVLIIQIDGFTVDREIVSEQFRFHIKPFAYGPSLPVEAYGHIEELPMYSAGEDQQKFSV